MATRQTLIAELIDQVNLEARYDSEAKRLVSLSVILAWLLKSCVEEFRQFDIDFIMKSCFIGVPEISEHAVHMDMPDRPVKTQYVQTMNSESNSITEHTIHYDIRFRAKVPGTNSDVVELIVNVEIQGDASTLRYVIRRGFYYCSRMVSEQFGVDFTDEHYENIKKVVSIWICPSTAEYKRDSIIEVHSEGNCLYGDLKINEDDVNLFQVVVLNLNDESEESEEKIIRLLSVLLSDKDTPEQRKKILQDEFGIEMTEEFERRFDTVCNLSEAVKQKQQRELAEEMLKDGEKFEKIKKYTHLSDELLRKIASALGVAIVL